MTTDNVVNQKLKMAGNKTASHKFCITRNLKKDSDIVIGYISDQCNENAPLNQDSLLIQDGNDTYYAPVSQKKKFLHYTTGYVKAGENTYIGLQKSLIPVLSVPAAAVAMICAAIIVLYSMLKPNSMTDNSVTDTPVNPVEISESTVAIGDIPKEESSFFKPMAYITGQNLTTISEKQPNVYLQNDAQNTEYYLEYEVYINEGTEASYQSKKVPAGSAEEWNAYECEQVHDGENSIWYKVSVYDLNGELLAKTTIDGLRLVKK